MFITARYRSRCSRCGEPIQPGDRVEWDPARRKAWHAKCCGWPECQDCGEWRNRTVPCALCGKRMCGACWNWHYCGEGEETWYTTDRWEPSPAEQEGEVMQNE